VARTIKGLDADQRRTERRRKLLDAALDLFAARGYAETSIEQLCQDAAVSTKGFYELFDGKEACFLALLDETTDRLTGAIGDALRSAPEGQAAQAAALAFAHGVADDPRVARAVFAQAGGISPRIERRRRRNRVLVVDFLTEQWFDDPAVDAGEGALRPVAVGFVGGVFDILADWLEGLPLRRRPRPPDIEALAGRIATFYEITYSGLTRHHH
jgi:AcrR family transcriptional regulator